VNIVTESKIENKKSKVSIAVAGAAGRMGRRIIALASADPELACVAALESSDSLFLGRDIGELAGMGHTGLAVTMSPSSPFDVLIDFSTPTGTLHWLRMCEQTGTPIVIGVTGHDAGAQKAIVGASKKTAVLKAANMSLGVNILLRMVRDLAARLGPDFDIEIVEAHHRHKADAPSGTAIALKDAIVDGRAEQKIDSPVALGRRGLGARVAGEIGMHSLRLGATAGEHTVHFASAGETITVGHTAVSRDTFAAGALRAARWLRGKPAGFYDMQNVLFENS
jgi:4-hydroxy-tetrahydrodipicolinate reductase